MKRPKRHYPDQSITVRLTSGDDLSFVDCYDYLHVEWQTQDINPYGKLDIHQARVLRDWLAKWIDTYPGDATEAQHYDDGMPDLPF